MVKLLVVTLVGASVVGGSVLAQPRRPATNSTSRKIYPGDDSARVPAFLAFRGKLERIVLERDETALLNDYLDPNLAGRLREHGFGEFWRELSDVLRLGVGSVGSQTFKAPYFLTKLPADIWNEGHGSGYLVIVGPNVAVHEAPTFTSKVIARLSYDLVKRRNSDSDATEPDERGYVWREISTPAGSPGYVYSRFARDQCDPAATFRLDVLTGRWRLETLGTPCE